MGFLKKIKKYVKQTGRAMGFGAKRTGFSAALNLPSYQTTIEPTEEQRGGAILKGNTKVTKLV